MLEIGCLRQLHIPLSFILWCCLLVLCWPLALFAIIMLAVVWLLALPFRILGVAVTALLAFMRAVLFLPSLILGYGT